ncbi:ankyrin repeat domain-containing protein [uncultured Thiodictyon sp.]|uniref:ankyrin repeat domain-containing protein n=1 Tax=uncultured Thiodictyon sp. TaxID=1846217 RepID=UPI0025F4DBF0|nr:ankyrin repeat domain-containing protein [uncultured Thiodictyon sp.]
MRQPPTLLVIHLALALLVLLPAGCDQPAPPTVNLFRALQVDNLDQIRRHIAAGTDLNQSDRNGDRPLHLAARAGQVAIARELVDHGASLIVLDSAGRTPLELALSQGKTQVATLLVEAGAPLDAQVLLVTLVRAGVSDRDSVDFLLRRGADLNRPDAAGQTPLHQAVALGHLETVKRLIARGADVNRPDGTGRTPLALARALDPKATKTADIQTALQQSGARP